MAARGRKSGPSRLDLRRQNEAVEAREEEEKDDDEEVDEEEDEEEDEEAEDVPVDEDDAGDDDDDEDAPKKKKKKVVKKEKAPPKKPAKKRAPKEVRMKAVWVILDNSSKRVGTFPFNQKKQAHQALAKKQEDKGTFYIQLIKEPLDA